MTIISTLKTRMLLGILVTFTALVTPVIAHADSPVACSGPATAVVCTWPNYTHTGQYIVQQGEIETGVDGNSYTFDASSYTGEGVGYGIDLIWRNGGAPYTGAGHFLTRLAGNAAGETPISFSASTSQSIFQSTSLADFIDSVKNAVSTNILVILGIIAFIYGLYKIFDLVGQYLIFDSNGFERKRH